MRVLISLLFLSSLVLGCSSNPHKAEEIETEMERSEAVSGDTKLGVKEGNLVVQKKVLMNEELRRLQNEVFTLEDKVYGNRKYGSEGLYGALKKCRAELSSKRLGGDGKLKWTEPIDRVTDKEEEYEIGIDEEDKLVGVSEEFLKDRIKRFKQYKMVLQKRQDEDNERVEICDTELKARKYEAEQKKKKQAKSSSLSLLSYGFCRSFGFFRIT